MTIGLNYIYEGKPDKGVPLVEQGLKKGGLKRTDDAKLRQMSEQGRQSAQARFCASRIIPKYEDFYRDVLERAS